jgi:hypothetical protein
MVERCLVLVVRDGESVVHAAMVVADGIDRPVALHQDETGARRIQEYHLPFGVVDKCLQPTTSV